jgi:cytochrome c553
MKTPRYPRWTGALWLLAAPCVWAQDPLLARNLAATCASCHGTNGHAVDEMKPLAGMPADRIVQLVAEFGNATRPATVMHQIARGFTAEQIRLIAGYFAAQPAAR